MTKKIKLSYLKLELLLRRINSKLPRFLRMTKFGIITTFISLILSVSVVYAQGTEANLDTFREKDITYLLKNLDEGIGPKTINPITGETETGAIYYVNSFISQTYEQTDEVSAVAFLEDTARNAGLVRPVQAEASGYTMMQPVLRLWRIVRNVALSFIVAIGLVLVVMILFRLRSGQEYVSILNALPKMIAAILLILFSFSIGGLMLDISTIGTKLVVGLFYSNNLIDIEKVVNPELYPRTILSSDPSQDFGEPYAEAADYNIFRLMSGIVDFSAWGPYGEDQGCDTSDPDAYMPWKDIDGHPYQDMCGLQIKDIIDRPTNFRLLDAGIYLTDSIGTWSITLIFDIFILMTVFKVFFALIQSFVLILLRVVSAPIQFMLIPVQGLGVLISWLRHVLAQVLVFPGTLAMILIAAFLGNYVGKPPFYINGSPDTDLFEYAPNLISHSVEQGGLNFIGRIIAIVVISQIPNLPKLIEQALQTTTPDFAGEVGQKLKAAASKIPIVGGVVNWLS